MSIEAPGAWELAIEPSGAWEVATDNVVMRDVVISLQIGAECWPTLVLGDTSDDEHSRDHHRHLQNSLHQGTCSDIEVPVLPIISYLLEELCRDRHAPTSNGQEFT